MHVENVMVRNFPGARGRKTVKGHRSSSHEQEEDDSGKRRKQWPMDGVDDRLYQNRRFLLGKTNTPHTTSYLTTARSERHRDGVGSHPDGGYGSHNNQSSSEGGRRQASTDSKSDRHIVSRKEGEGVHRYDDLNRPTNHSQRVDGCGFKESGKDRGKDSSKPIDSNLGCTGSRDAGRRARTHEYSLTASQNLKVDGSVESRSNYKVYKPSVKAKPLPPNKLNSAKNTASTAMDPKNTKVGNDEGQGSRVLIRSVRRLARSNQQESPGSRGSERPKIGLRTAATRTNDTIPNSREVGLNGNQVESKKVDTNGSGWDLNRGPMRAASKQDRKKLSKGELMMNRWSTVHYQSKHRTD